MWRTYLPNALYANLYGPTEITVDCTCYVVDREFPDDEPLPIGFPIHGTVADRNPLRRPRGTGCKQYIQNIRINTLALNGGNLLFRGFPSSDLAGIFRGYGYEKNVIIFEEAVQGETPRHIHIAKGFQA